MYSLIAIASQSNWKCQLAKNWTSFSSELKRHASLRSRNHFRFVSFWRDQRYASNSNAHLSQFAFFRQRLSPLRRRNRPPKKRGISLALGQLVRDGWLGWTLKANRTGLFCNHPFPSENSAAFRRPHWRRHRSYRCAERISSFSCVSLSSWRILIWRRSRRRLSFLGYVFGGTTAGWPWANYSLRYVRGTCGSPRMEQSTQETGFARNRRWQAGRVGKWDFWAGTELVLPLGVFNGRLKLMDRGWRMSYLFMNGEAVVVGLNYTIVYSHLELVSMSLRKTLMLY